MDSTTKDPKGSHNLGIIYSDESGKGLTHPYFSLILDAFLQEAQTHNYNITFINRKSGGRNGNSYLECCRESFIDGICMVCVDFTATEIKDLVDSDIPCVTIDHMFRHHPAVLSDNETGVQKLVEYAIKCGHRRIAFIHGHNNSIVTRTRINQFCNVMAYHNIPIPPEYLREGLYNDIRSTRKIVKELLKLPERPTCILLPDDITYLGAQDGARELGFSIPDDISFGGYDGIPISQALTPKLTTIRQSCEEIGRTAADRLVELIENPDTARKTPSIFPVELIKGGTITTL